MFSRILVSIKEIYVGIYGAGNEALFPSSLIFSIGEKRSIYVLNNAFFAPNNLKMESKGVKKGSRVLARVLEGTAVLDLIVILVILVTSLALIGLTADCERL